MGPMPLDDAAAEATRRWLAAMWNPHTRAAYARDVTQWLRWGQAMSVDPMVATRDDIEAYVADMRWERATRIRKLGALSSWYKTVGEAGLSGVNPARPLAG